MSDELSQSSEQELAKLNKVVMIRELREQKYGTIGKITNKTGIVKDSKYPLSQIEDSYHRCLFCKETGNMIFFQGKYFCINCYNQLMKKR